MANKVSDVLDKMNQQLDVALTTGVAIISFEDMSQIPMNYIYDFGNGTTCILVHKTNDMLIICGTVQADSYIAPNAHPKCMEKLILIKGDLKNVARNRDVSSIEIYQPGEAHAFYSKNGCDFCAVIQKVL